MRNLLALVAVASLVGCSAPTRPDDLVGSWRVDLRPTPDASPYYQRLEVTGVESGRLNGTFYGSPITDGRVNADWGELRFAFVTRDNSGAYHHAGVLRAGRLEGMTNSIAREFLAVWTGERDEP